MNTTLTGLGILLVLALATALVGPFLIDWNGYRADFERQASAQLGMPVAIAGDIDARLLPMPFVRLADVTVGTAGSTQLRVRDLQLKLGLTPLLRSRFEFDDVVMDSPRLDLALDERGWPVWSPGAAAGAGLAEVVLRRIAVTDGSVDVVNLATGSRQHAEGIRAIGEAGSLQGPFKLDGTAAVEGAPFHVQLNTGRRDEAGGLRTKLEIEAVDRPLVVRMDGTLQTGGDRARYVGALVVQRPAPAAARASGDQPAADPAAAAAEPPVAEPWRVEGRVAADIGAVTMELFDVQYGPDERALKLTGSGSVTLGPAPRFEASVAARQLDFDRALRREGEPTLTVSQAVARLRETFPAGLPSTIPGRLGLDVSGAVIGGDIVQDLHADVELGAAGWTVSQARARLPGSTALTVAGRLALQPQTGFAGRVDTRIGELSGLLYWLGGNVGPRARTAVRSIVAGGDVVASADAVSIDALKVDADRTSAEGRLRWTAASAGGRATLEATLAARELRLDEAALTALSRLSGGASDTFPDWLAATDLKLKLSADQLQLGDVEAAQLSADLDATAAAVDIRALSFRGPGDSRVSAKGWMSLDPGASEGRLEAAIAAGRIGELVRAAGRVLGPQPVLQAIADRADALSPADLRLTLSRSAAALDAVLAGTAAGTAIDASARTSLGPQSSVTARGTFANPDGARLLAQVGVPAIAGTGGAGRLSFDVLGGSTGALTVSLKGAAAGFDLSSRGNVGVTGQSIEGANLGFTVSGPDLGTVLVMLGRGSPGAAALPLHVAGEVLYGKGQIAFANLDGKLGSDSLRGRLQFEGTDWSRLSGRLAFDQFGADALVALAFGPDALAEGGGRSATARAWPAGAFGLPPLSGIEGTVAIAADRFRIPGGLEARDAAFLLALRPSGITVSDFKATLARGQLTGTASMLNDGGDGSFSAMTRLSGASLADLLARRGARPPGTGLLDLATDMQTAGRSLSAMAAALGGGGTFVVRSATLLGLDPAVFAKASGAVERGEDVSPEKLLPRLEADLFSAPLPIQSLDGAFAIASGNLRAVGLKAEADGAALSGEVSLDLANAAVDATLSLGIPPQPRVETPPPIVVHLEGPLTAPVRRLEATAFANFIGMRAVEIETRRVEQMEADIHERRMLNQRRRMIEVEKRWVAEAKAAEERRAAEARALEERRAAEARAEQARAEQARAEQARAEQERAAAAARAAAQPAPPSNAESEQRAAWQERVRQQQLRIEEERARRLGERAPAMQGPNAIDPRPGGSGQAVPAAGTAPPPRTLPPMPTPTIIAPSGARSSLDVPPAARPVSRLPQNFIEFEKSMQGAAN